MNSREKGCRGERELASELRNFGYDCRRGQQYSGVSGDADVIGLPFLHIECKRVEKLNLTEAYAQAKSDAKGKIPVVMHRKNHEDWRVTLSLQDFMQMYTNWECWKTEGE